MKGNVFKEIGFVTEKQNFVVSGLKSKSVINENIHKLKDIWQNSLSNTL